MRRSIISIAAGRIPARDDPADGLARGAHRGEVESIVRTSGGVRVRRTVTSVTTPERALAADDEAAQVVARRVGRRAAQAQHLAVGEHELHARARAGR